MMAERADELRARIVDLLRPDGHQPPLDDDDPVVLSRGDLAALLAELEARDAAISEVVNELRFRASQTNAAGQVEPPYTAVSLRSIADVLAASGGGSDG